MDEGSVIVQLTKLPSISLDHSVEGDMKVQRAILKQVPEVEAVIARVGSDELGLDPMSPNETDSFLQLKPREEWRVADKEWLLGELRKVMAAIPRNRADFHAADRNAHFGNADRRARRSGDQAVRPRHRRTRAAGGRDPGPA